MDGEGEKSEKRKDRKVKYKENQRERENATFTKEKPFGQLYSSGNYCLIAKIIFKISKFLLEIKYSKNHSLK